MSKSNTVDISRNKLMPETDSDEDSKSTKDNVKFWASDPNVILDRKYVFELFPVETMSYNQKLNAITRMILILSLVTFIITKNMRMLLISGLTIGAIFFLHKFHTEKTIRTQLKMKEGMKTTKEGFDTESDYRSNEARPISKDKFQLPTSTNPFANVMINDYDYNPDKKPAAPSSNPTVNTEIMKQAKRLVEEANPDQPDISDKLFKDLGQELNFEQSMRQFSSMPSTTIPNDQGAFVDFCYGDMISCKEGNLFACSRNLNRHVQA
jgi:hypothetical protein